MTDQAIHTLDTPFGTIRIRPNGDKGIYVGTPDAIPGQPDTITVNRVECDFQMWLFDYGDGFELQRQNGSGHPDYQALYLRRREWQGKSYYAQEASGAARDKVLKILIPLIAAWAKAHPEALAEAQLARETEALHHLFSEREAAQRRLADLNAKIENQNRAVEAAQERLADAMHRPVAATAGAA